MLERCVALLEAEHLTKRFPVTGVGPLRLRRSAVHAVNGVTFAISRGETLALVGESGSGKSTIGRLALGLLEPDGGVVKWKGRDMGLFKPQELPWLRSQMQIIFQDPLSSLNPRRSVQRVLSEPLRLHRRAEGQALRDRVDELLATVGLTPPSLYRDRFPHELSGGQRQRIGIARAISLQPELIVADEPVSSLDVSVQAQILNLLTRLQRQMGISYLFITHNLSVARCIAQRVMVLYLGEVVEAGPVGAVFAQPLHPYSQALLSATPIPDPRRARQRSRIILRGEMPSPVNPPPGCCFHTRCPETAGVCQRTKPPLRPFSEGRQVACHLVPNH